MVEERLEVEVGESGALVISQHRQRPDGSWRRTGAIRLPSLVALGEALTSAAAKEREQGEQRARALEAVAEKIAGAGGG